MTSKNEEIQDLISKIDTITGENGKLFVQLPDAGTKVQVYECKGKDIGMVLRLITVLARTVDIASLSGATSAEKQQDVIFGLMQTIATNADLVYDTASALCDMEARAIKELKINDVVTLLGAVTKVNVDFFSRTVLPLLVKVTGREESQSESPKAGATKGEKLEGSPLL